jgi:hypothetical protein
MKELERTRIELMVVCFYRSDYEMNVETCRVELDVGIGDGVRIGIDAAAILGLGARMLLGSKIVTGSRED